jgi:small subunit ribosomal protein S21
MSRQLLSALDQRREFFLQVLVRDNNVDQALRVLKKKMQREGVFREMKRRRFYEKPSERSNREQAEAIRRARKLARKKAQREGLIAAPKGKKVPPRRPTAWPPLAGAGEPRRLP